MPYLCRKMEQAQGFELDKLIMSDDINDFKEIDIEQIVKMIEERNLKYGIQSDDFLKYSYIDLLDKMEEMYFLFAKCINTLSFIKFDNYYTIFQKKIELLPQGKLKKVLRLIEDDLVSCCYTSKGLLEEGPGVNEEKSDEVSFILSEIRDIIN